MESVKERITLQIVEDRLRITAVIECAKLRVRRQLMDFVVDTGSSASYLSDKDVRRLQIPMRNKAAGQEVDFGGSRFRQIILPSFRLHLLKEDNAVVDLTVSLNALQTTKKSEEKRQIAQTLPSILGMNFLKQQKLSLHVLPSEGIAYLQRE